MNIYKHATYRHTSSAREKKEERDVIEQVELERR
jgi:hypothetical protein